ncbi:MAG TPA: hypothetical protein VGR32_11115 [Brevundimonas sp.]|jgi:hypothetical protein|uniref:hypothetical protein n=1 Tax=Brevundimonas sp. TaxID=1871086 RepID=UPI002DE3C213|nr:hypothetical protein [Brevundimonas sp.]
MTETEIPASFLSLFAAAFLANAAYIGSLFLLHRRVSSPDVQPRGYEVPPLFPDSPAKGMRFLGFVFSSRHVEFGDQTVSRLVWLTRAFFVVGGVLTISLFGYALGLM